MTLTATQIEELKKLHEAANAEASGYGRIVNE